MREYGYDVLILYHCAEQKREDLVSKCQIFLHPWENVSIEANNLMNLQVCLLHDKFLNLYKKPNQNQLSKN